MYKYKLKPQSNVTNVVNVYNKEGVLLGERIISSNKKVDLVITKDKLISCLLTVPVKGKEPFQVKRAMTIAELKTYSKEIAKPIRYSANPELALV